MSKFNLEITNDCEILMCPKKRTKKIINILNKSKYKIYNGSLSIVFTSNKVIAEIHRKFLNNPLPTDVITFPGIRSEGVLGEIIISAEQAYINCKEYNNSFNNELSLYLIHGWLHLYGLNDKNEEEIKIMRKAEKENLLLINKNIVNMDFNLRYG